MATMAPAMAASSGLRGMSAMKERSILSRQSGSGAGNDRLE